MLDADLSTLAVRAGIHRSQFNEHCEPLFLTSSFVFESAAQAQARFAGTDEGPVYGRYTNPTVSAFEERLAALEGAECCVAFASGMAAIMGCVMGLLKSGDHIVASQSLFGATVQLLANQFSKFGVRTTFVTGTEPAAWEAAVEPSTKLMFLETPSNPLTQVYDIAAFARIARAKGIWLAVDNCFCTPVLQRPLDLGADIVIHSATKFLDGQGRVLGGAVLGKKELIQQSLTTFLRNAGPTLSPFNAWLILKGMETLKIRMEAQSASALALAAWLESHPRVARVYYPGLRSHPQYELASRQQKLGGAILSFEVRGGQEAAWRVIDRTQLISITANLGDVKTTITHPATTTHLRVTPETRAAAGITERLIRLAIGLESAEDLKRDLERGLNAI
ncbi:MAG: O-succinylhomoserine sulfhydrylase [Betaproteobacteria bacterium]|nr:O-succinylhomoserine sulfhydrylase [Betaproteobacteria bacterium]